MDLLGSILNSMDKPPSIKNEQKELLKRQKEQMIKKQAAEKANLKRFREQIEKRITEFIKDSSMQKFKFEPMDKVSRSIIHDVADVGGLTAFSFGDDEVDRHVMIFKKEFAPSDEELLAYRKGEEWNPEKVKEEAQQKLLAKENEINEGKLKNILPNTNYKEKYEKLLGKEAGKDAAKITVPNKQFGFVPSDNKRDQRSIEQTLADIRAKKKQKTEQTESQK